MYAFHTSFTQDRYKFYKIYIYIYIPHGTHTHTHIYIILYLFLFYLFILSPQYIRLPKRDIDSLSFYVEMTFCNQQCHNRGKQIFFQTKWHQSKSKQFFRYFVLSTGLRDFSYIYLLSETKYWTNKSFEEL